MDDLKDKKIAIVVEELTQLGGAERVLDAVIEVFPNAPIYTLVWDKEKTHHIYDKKDIRTSFIQKMPRGVKRYKWYLSLMPKAVESFRLGEFDIIISITSAFVKGIKTREDQLHFCICNTPTRFLWSDPDYVKTAPIPFYIRPFMPLVLKYLKKWDLKASKRPTYILANSKNVQERIRKYYKRESEVLYPNVETNKFMNAKFTKENYYLLVSRIEPYKKVDLVIEAFKRLEREQLVIIGAGSKAGELNEKSPKNIKFLGRVSEKELVEYYAKAKGFILPQNEDFGITPVESMAAGTPVVAYKKGGALETVIDGKTGVLFYPQTVEALVSVIKNFRPYLYKKVDLQKQAAKFDQAIFKEELLAYIKDKIKVKNNRTE